MSHNHLRRYRKRGAFTQSEIAFVLGIDCGTKVSRYENVQSTPDIFTILAYQLFYDVPVQELFPKIYQEMAIVVAERARELFDELAKQPDHPITNRKLQMLKAVTARMIEVSASSYEKQRKK
jgi:transcriptional regulator with XRE-family HTH domain